MIKRVELKNFQIHKKLVREFSRDLPNVLHGPSDIGKTAIIRAISWVLNDTPKTKAVIRAGTSRVQVGIETWNGESVIRTASQVTTKDGDIKISNHLQIIYPNGEKKEYKRFRYTGDGSISREIRDILGISFAVVDDGTVLDLSIHDQLEAPFLLSDTPFNRAQVIGTMGGVTIIDSAIDSMAHDVRSNRLELDRLQNQIEDVSVKERELSWAVPLHERVKDEIEPRFHELETDDSKLSVMKRYGLELSRMHDDMTRLSYILSFLEDVQALEERLQVTRLQASLYKELKLSYENLMRLDPVIDRLELELSILQNMESLEIETAETLEAERKTALLKNLESDLSLIDKRIAKELEIDSKLLNLKAVEETLPQLLQDFQKSQSLSSALKTLSLTDSNIRSQERELELVSEELDSLELKYRETLESLEICPLCGSRISH